VGAGGGFGGGFGYLPGNGLGGLGCKWGEIEKGTEPNSTTKGNELRKGAGFQREKVGEGWV